jgi:hypothetical protein
MDKLKDSAEKLKELENKLPESYLGQGAVYVIEGQNMTFQNEMLTPNGPEFALHQWNMRPTLESNIDSFFKMTDVRKQLAPMLQENALIFVVSPRLIDVKSLAKYRSGQFPMVKFKSDEGKLNVVAGHHHIKVLVKSNLELLNVKQCCLQFLKNVNKGKTNAQLFEDNQKELVEVSKQLWNNGKWGVVFLDHGKFDDFGYLFI